MRVIIDTNVLVSSALSINATPARIFERFRAGAFELIVTEEILAEYRRALGYERARKRHGFTLAQIDETVGELAKSAKVVEANEIARISTDPDDDKFLACALAGEADYIISGDKHLLRLQQYEGVQILSPAAFLLMLGQE